MTTIPNRIPSTDGVELEIHDLGGTGPLLLLSHATGFCGRVWEPMVATLGAHYRCVAFDFRSHGLSSRPADRPLEWQAMADDVLAVADAISPDRPIPAIGHSMGGTTLALAEVRRPGTVARAWTFEPILFGELDDPTDPEPSAIAEGARRRRAVFPDRAEVLTRYGSRPPLSVLDPRALAAYVEHGFEDLPDGTVRLRCRPEDEASIFEHHNSGARTLIGEVTIPFLIAAGGGNGRPVVGVKETAADFPHLELREYPDLTHFGPLQDPERIAADCLAWLAG
ncbi:MAG: alpha/beta hydrolase [Actinomycetota bacterium]